MYKEEGETMDKLYSCDEVAQRYNVKTITVWEWIRTKKLGAVKIGKSYRVSENDMKRFEDACRV